MTDLKQAAQQALEALESGLAFDAHSTVLQNLREALAQTEQGPVAYPFVVRHYIGEKRPSIKGHGFDGLEVGTDREEAERFVAWVNAHIIAPPQQQAEPSKWRDMVVVTLVREGIDKHKARELADHFAAQPEPPPEWVLIKNILDEYGLQAISFVAEWKAAQRPWVGLEAEDLAQIESDEFWQTGNHMAIAMAVEDKLKERNT